ncbi:MAG TPA: hypothetical protein VMZ31_12215 [Phycisphaerae bacterium]|nr:hypothetical protein [Phycisphaerae bacterium]
MYHNSEKTSETVALVRKLLELGRPQEAAEVIRQFGAASAELRNAYGVCLMRTGQTGKAVELYRKLVMDEKGINLKRDVPTIFKTNFATALLLARNAAGCLSVLDEMADSRHPAVVRVRDAVARWRRSLGWWRRVWLAMYGSAPATPVVLDFPPGDLDERPSLRPAA